MTPERYQELRRSFEELLELRPEERARTLQEISNRDAEFGAELRRLLAEHGRTAALLDRPPVEAFAHRKQEARQLGPYFLQREIGSGGMGVVYEAMRVDGSYRKRVAIKILRRDLSSKVFLTRFGRERQILARLEHPHIASIFDAGETPDGDPYFVMEHVDGIPITKYAETHGLTVSQRLDLFLQACDAVQYAHRNLTVHRDLKPSNILVTEAGAVKLLDFGVAKLIETEADTAAAPATEALLTPAYTSPEQIRREPASTSGDVFQLGILLYELLAGEHPFQRKGRLPHEVMRAICEDDPPPPSEFARNHARQIRGELDTIVLTALRKQPSWRYPSVEQMADDIGRYRRGWPVLATGNSVAYRLRKFARRQWLALAATAAVILLLMAGILVTLRQARLAEMARAEAEQQRAAANRQRDAAERAQAVAAEQRQKALEHYQEVRALASSLLFDLYDGVRDLAGSDTARRLIVAKVQHQLELLNTDSGQDIGLQRDLAASYERMGELRVDARQSDKNDAGAAVESYRHAVALRKQLVSRGDALPRDRRDLALSLAKLGDGEFLASDATRRSPSGGRILRIPPSLGLWAPCKNGFA
jgi:tRNA A-37 threonylcarbamoyl transferase component Bud32